MKHFGIDTLKGETIHIDIHYIQDGKITQSKVFSKKLH